MENITREIFNKISVGDYIKVYYHLVGSQYRPQDAVYEEGFVTLVTGISIVLHNDLVIYYTSMDKIEIGHRDMDLGL